MIALFSTGLKLERALHWREWSTVTRLLVIGMPVFIALRARCSAWPSWGSRVGAAIVLAARARPHGPRAGRRHRRRAARRRGRARAALRDQRRGRLQRRAGVPVRAARAGHRGEGRASSSGRSPTSSTRSRVGIAVGAAMGYGIAALMVSLRDRELLIPALDGWVARRRPRSPSTAWPRCWARTASWPCSPAGSRSGATSTTTS